MTSPLIIRPAEANDAERISQLIHSVAGAELFFFGHYPSSDWQLNRQRQFLIFAGLARR
jgi:hypothetical protein